MLYRSSDGHNESLITLLSTGLKMCTIPKMKVLLVDT